MEEGRHRWEGERPRPVTQPPTVTACGGRGGNPSQIRERLALADLVDAAPSFLLQQNHHLPASRIKQFAHQIS